MNKALLRCADNRLVRSVRRAINKSEQRAGNQVRTAPKPGTTFYFTRRGTYLGFRPAAAAYLPASPKVNGRRMRYERGRLVPR